MSKISKIALLTIDSLRYDCVGYQPDKKHLKKDHVLGLLETPTMDELCKESVCFTKCYSPSSLTPEVLASIFTGTTQINHKIRNNTRDPKAVINQNINTMAEIFKKLGYTTVFSSDAPYILHVPKITKGFDHDFSLNDKGLFSFLAQHEDENIFLFTLFVDVHIPYLHSSVPPTENYNDDVIPIMKPIFKRYGLPFPKKPINFWNDLYKIDTSRNLWFPLYVQGVTKFDQGRLKYFLSNLQTCGFSNPETSLLAVTSDHGEGKRMPSTPDLFQHGGEAYDEIARVPLIVRMPDFKHEIRNELVSNMDLYKLILDLCTENKTEQLSNHKIHSINPLLDKRDHVGFVFALESFHGDGAQYHVHTRTIITDTKKYTLRGTPETFLNPETFELSNHDFVTKLYDDLYATKAPEISFKTHLESLEKKKLSKKELYEKFLENPRYQKFNPFSIFDLTSDPFEEQEINPTKDLITLMEYYNYLPLLIELEKPDILDEDKQEISEQKTDQEVEKELRGELERLGYV